MPAWWRTPLCRTPASRRSTPPPYQAIASDVPFARRVWTREVAVAVSVSDQAFGARGVRGVQQADCSLPQIDLGEFVNGRNRFEYA